MPEDFDIKKAFDLRPTALGKSTSAVSKGLLVLGVIVLSGWSIWVTYIKPHTRFAAKTQTQVIRAEKGSVINVQQKQEAPKRRFIPFCEVGVGQSRNERLNTFVKFGVRAEW